MNTTLNTYQAEIDYRVERIRKEFGSAPQRHHLIPRVRRHRGAESVR
jgi:hypothetical protein